MENMYNDELKKRIRGRRINSTAYDKNEYGNDDVVDVQYVSDGGNSHQCNGGGHNCRKKSNSKIVPFAILVVLISFICGFLGALFVMYFKGDTVTTVNTSSVSITETNSIADAVEKVYDAVVVVESYQNNQLYSTGTGFVYKQEGGKSYIMTNNHVVDGGDVIKVLFNDGTELETDVVGADTYSDIAVLSIDKTENISVAATGSTDEVRVGDTVFTVGSPEGADYAGTVTKGIISGKDRLVAVSLSSSTTSDYYMSVLQTDAAINPGNSGGPLCNVNGEVIGITNMKLVDDSVEGMGFAIPIEDALTYAEMLEENGKISRPYVGISMLDVSDSYYLWQAGITIPSDVSAGVVVYSVEDNSPASKASLQKGDIIVKIDDEDVSSLADFRYLLYKYSPGDVISVTYYRNGSVESCNITLGESTS